MSQSEIQRFAAYLAANPRIASAFENNRMSSAVKVAAERGFHFTVDDMKTFMKGRIEADGRALSDRQLDKIAAGYSIGSCMESIHCCL